MSAGSRWAAQRLDEVATVPGEAGEPRWHPLQHAFGLTAFGANVFVASAPEEVLVEEHDEAASGQEELYLVLAGEVRFEVEDDAFSGGRWTVVAIPEPSVRRRAVACEAGATLLALGARPGCFETTWRAAHFSDVALVPPGRASSPRPGAAPPPPR